MQGKYDLVNANHSVINANPCDATLCVCAHVRVDECVCTGISIWRSESNISFPVQSLSIRLFEVWSVTESGTHLI